MSDPPPADEKRRRELALGAERYVLNALVANLWGRLVIIHDGGGDVARVGERLREIIEEMVVRLGGR